MSIKVMTRVWDHCPQQGEALLVMLAMADWCNDEGECHPSVPKLAAKARIAVRSVYRVLNKLESDDEIEIEVGGGRGKTSVYRLAKYAAVVKCEPRGNSDGMSGYAGKSDAVSRNRNAETLTAVHVNPDSGDKKTLTAATSDTNIYEPSLRTVNEPSMVVVASDDQPHFDPVAPVYDTTGNVNGTSTASQTTDTSKPEPTKARSAAARQSKAKSEKKPTVKKESVPLTPAELDLRDAILDACGWSWDVLARNDRINTVGLARKLAKAGRTRANVVAGASYFARNDWRGKRHEKPGIAALETSIGAATKEASADAPPPPSTRWAHAFDPPPVFAADDGWGVVEVAP